MAKKNKAKTKKSYNNYIIAIDTPGSWDSTDLFKSTKELTEAIREGNFLPKKSTRFFSMGPELHYEMTFETVPVTKTKATLKVIKSA